MTEVHDALAVRLAGLLGPGEGAEDGLGREAELD